LLSPSGGWVFSCPGESQSGQGPDRQVSSDPPFRPPAPSGPEGEARLRSEYWGGFPGEQSIVSDLTPMDVVHANWGDAPPDWIQRLAEECTSTTQNKVAARLGRSASLVSAVLRGKYTGDMRAVEDLVRGRLMRETFVCPALGNISSGNCLDWRAQAKAFSNENSEARRMYRACRSCPRYLGGQK